MVFENFTQSFPAAARAVGAHSAACIRMDNPLLRQRISENNTVVSEWLKSGRQGEMEYLNRLFLEKSNPWETFPLARSVIVLAFSHHWGDSSISHPFPLPKKDALLGYISAYARGSDYHSVGREMLTELKKTLGVEGVVAVDTLPVYERLFATVSGLGVVGGNNLLRVPGQTSVRVFIGCLFVDTELPEVILAPQMSIACTTCRACLNQCPTGAIEFDRPIDARKCISYLTIEKRAILSREEGEKMGDWLFGCDDCTTACPPFNTVDGRIPIDLEWLLKTSSAEIRRTLKGNAAAYAGVTQLRKNAVVLLKKRGTPRARALIEWVRENSGSELILKQIDQW